MNESYNTANKAKIYMISLPFVKVANPVMIIPARSCFLRSSWQQCWGSTPKA
jgi:hypothetical protein